MDFRDFAAAQGRQVRTLPLADLRAEGREATDEMALVGYAARYGVLSHNLGGFREQIRAGAFRRAVAAQSSGEGVVCLWNHDPNNGILGRTTAGTLKISEDDKGLFFRCKLDRNQQLHRDIHSSIQRRDTNSCSFAFTVPSGGDKWESGVDPEDGKPCAMRTLLDVDLLDCSPVCYPAYPQTSVDARHRLPIAAAFNTPEARKQIEKLRKLAQADAMLHDLNTNLRQHPYPPPYDYASLDRFYKHAMELCEAAFACSDLISDTLDDWDDDEENGRAKRIYPYDAHSALRSAHAESHAAVSGASEAFARTRLALERCMTKK